MNTRLTLKPLAFAVLLALPCLAHADPLNLADFENGLGGLEGPIQRDDTVAKDGKASGKITAQLADVTQRAWVTVRKPLDLRNPVKSVSFWVKSAEAKQITVQVVDSTKQTLQVRPILKPGPDWQRIQIDSFESGPGFQAYGGAGDKKVHWPLAFLNLLVEKNGLEGGNGTVWIDGLQLETEGAPKTVSPTVEEATAGTNKVVLADFEAGLGGFTGPLSQDTTGGKDSKAAGRIEAQLANVERNAWVTVTRPLDLKNEIKVLSFWVKSAEARQLTAGLIDATGQTFQVRPALNPGAAWQQVVIPSFESGAGFQSYGGANDKKVHWPAKSFSVIVEKTGLEGGNGTVLLDNVEAFVSTARIVGNLDLRQDKPGNVFYTGEPVRLPVETQGDTVSWKITDFWGKPVAEGTAAVADKTAVIAPTVPATGYYEVQLQARKGEAKIAEAVTTFVVTTPFDLSQVKDSPFGLMTHFAQGWPTDVIPVLARSGAKSLRDELYWGHVEQKKGEFVFNERFENYMAALKAAHIDPLIVLSFGNPNYDNTPDAPGYGNAPYTDEGRAAYARYATEVLKHYGSQIKAVEVWNEYNGTFGKGPAAQDKARYYDEMIKVAYPAIRKARPDVEVVGISAVATPMPYFEDLFKRGALAYMDSLSLHPYRTQSAPEGLERQLLKLRKLIDAYAKGKPMPIWLTELGWYVKLPDGRSDIVVTEADQAKYLVRSYALALSAGTEKFYWYHARDDGPFPTSGILRSPDDPKGRYAPKPAFAAFANLTRQLTGAQFEKREPVLNEETYSLLFKRDNQPVRVMWSLQPQTVTVKAAAPLQITDIMGVSQTLPATGGQVKLTLGDVPIYVRGAFTGLPPVDALAGKVIAVAEDDFSEKQGGQGWQYGYFIPATADATYTAADWKPLPQYRTTIWGYEWIGAQKYLLISPASSHPSMENGKPVWAVRRYTAPAGGNLRLLGKVSRPDQGDGAIARILVDGREVWKQKVAGGEPSNVKYDVTVPVKPGSLIDFAVDPIASTEYDATFFSTTIVQLP